MLKMFSTQIIGVFKKIQEHNEFSFEDGARLLAQAVVGDGQVYICGFAEMAAVVAEATEGAEPLSFFKKWNDVEEVTGADRVLLFSRFSNDANAMEVARSLAELGVPVVAVCTVVEEAQEHIGNFADVVIDLKLVRGLLPDEHGNRVGLPNAMAGLFAYYGLKFTLEEFLEDIE
jgi:uncharacterized phosphosugar-binding protein